MAHILLKETSEEMDLETVSYDLNTSTINKALSELFISFKQDETNPSRTDIEKTSASTKQQKQGVGQQEKLDISQHRERIMQKQLPNEVGDLKSELLLDYLQHYGWMTGIKIDIDSDGKVIGNEWEHVMPFLSQIIFGGGIKSIPLLPTDGGEDSRRKYFKAIINNNEISREYVKKVIEHLQIIEKQGGDWILSSSSYTDTVSDYISTILKLKTQEKEDLYLNRLRLNVLTMGKCESWINQYKTNVILQKLVFDYNSGNLMNPRFENTNDRIDSFFDMMDKKKSKLQENIRDRDNVIWKHKKINKGDQIRIYRDIGHPSAKDWNNYKDNSPNLRDKWKENDNNWKEIAKHNTKLILKRVNNELNKNIHIRILFNCIKYKFNMKLEKSQPVSRLRQDTASSVGSASQSSLTGSTPQKGQPKMDPYYTRDTTANYSQKKIEKSKTPINKYIEKCLKILYPDINDFYKVFNNLDDNLDDKTSEYKKLLFNTITEALCPDEERMDTAEIIKTISVDWFNWLKVLRQRRIVITEDAINIQNGNVKRYIDSFNYCVDKKMALWCNELLYKNFLNIKGIDPNKSQTFHTGYQQYNTNISTIIYYLTKSMYLNLWGIDAQKKGNKTAIKINYLGKDIPAVDYTFYHQRKFFQVTEESYIPNKHASEQQNEAKWNDLAFWDTWSHFYKMDIISAFPPRDIDDHFQRPLLCEVEGKTPDTFCERCKDNFDEEADPNQYNNDIEPIVPFPLNNRQPKPITGKRKHSGSGKKKKTRKRTLQKKSRRKTKKQKKSRKIRRKKTRKYKRKKTRRRKKKMKGGGGCKNYKNKCDCLSSTNKHGVPCAWSKGKHDPPCHNINKVKKFQRFDNKESYIVPLERYKYGLDSETKDCYKKNNETAPPNYDKEATRYQNLIEQAKKNEKDKMPYKMPWEDEKSGFKLKHKNITKVIPKVLRRKLFHQKETGCNHLYHAHRSNQVDCTECVNHKNLGGTDCVFFTDPNGYRDPECHNIGKKDELEKDGWRSTTKEQCDNAYRESHKGIINYLTGQ